MYNLVTRPDGTVARLGDDLVCYSGTYQAADSRAVRIETQTHR
jgi:hypothetical protein